LSLLMLATVFLSFAQTYYLEGVSHAPPPSRTVHTHGAEFSCWMRLPMTQISLVEGGWTSIAAWESLDSFWCLMAVFGALAATDSLVRAAGPARRDVQAFYLVRYGHDDFRDPAGVRISRGAIRRHTSG
jgi:hypothetical protein